MNRVPAASVDSGTARVCGTATPFKRRATWVMAVVLILSLDGCSARRYLHRTSVTPVVETSAWSLGPPPRTYEEACRVESAVCGRQTEGQLPTGLVRKLHLPKMHPGEQCPSTSGQLVENSEFGGIVLGGGSVRLLIAQNLGAVTHGVAALGPSDTTRWWGFKTLWIGEPDYKGPFLIRAEQLDGQGPIALLDGAEKGVLVVPPVETVNGGHGYRLAPEGSYVRGPGCYGFQVDGTTFSETLVVKTVLTG
jgi:hypothetical protein